jgi:DNA processing protein
MSSATSIDNILSQPPYNHRAPGAVEEASMPRYAENVYWLAFAYKYSAANLEPLLSVYERYGSLKYLWDVSLSELSDSGLEREAIAEALTARKSVNLDDCERLRDRLSKRGVKLIKFFDEEYPAQLRLLRRQREGPPILLFHQGTLTSFNQCVAIVGTRVLSHYGHTVARQLARQLARQGCTIVSGLARGTDTK